MARPKLGEGDTHRLQIKISDEELSAIEDWRFENRIASRSEAVRRLVQIGLRADEGFPDSYRAVHRIVVQLGSWYKYFDDLDKGIDAPAFEEYFQEEIVKLAHTMNEVYSRLTSLGLEVIPFGKEVDLKAALKEADHAKRSLGRWLQTGVDVPLRLKRKEDEK